MPLFGRPIPFESALQSVAVRTVLPTTLNSEQYRKLGSEILRRTQFSAQVQSVDFLDQVAGVATDLATGKTSLATARAMLQRTRDAINEREMLDDARLDLILRTQTEMAQGYGQAVQGNDPDVIDAFPCTELFRLEDRQEPRDWEQRWRAAADEVGDESALRVLKETGHMIARKDSEIWQAIGDGAGGFTDTLSNPYPPFAFSSGMWTRDISRSEALQMGIDVEGVKPAALPDFNESLQSSYQFRSAAIRDELVKQGGVKMRGEVLVPA